MSTLATRHNTALTTLFETAARITEESRSFWTGFSGEQVTGEQVSRHLEAAAVLLEKHGWIRDYSDSPEPEFPDFDETTKVKEMLLKFFRFLRELYVDETRLTLTSALHDADNGRDGDDDTRYIAGRVMEAILQAHTGARSASYSSWSSKVGRTQEQVLELLAAGAMFARRYGPGSRPTFLAA